MNLKLMSALFATGIVCALESVPLPQSKDERRNNSRRHHTGPRDQFVRSRRCDRQLDRCPCCRTPVSTRFHTPHIIQESLGAGWGPISYRNNTELRMAAAWHWTRKRIVERRVLGKRGYFLRAAPGAEGWDPIRLHSSLRPSSSRILDERRQADYGSESHLLEKAILT